MNQEATRNFKQALVTQEKELSQRFTKLQEDVTRSHSADSSEQAQERENDEVVDKLFSETQVELRLVRHALSTIEQGTYGICEQCGEDIALARLEIIPYTNVCMKCAAD